jgi:alkylation response protein AidB-like acyl-CoA dehydrogenase
MYPFLDQEQLVLRIRVHSWAKENLFSVGKKEDDIEREARRLVARLGREGFTAHTVPKSYGGVRNTVLREQNVLSPMPR